MNRRKKILLMDMGGILFKPLWKNIGIKNISNKLKISPDFFKIALKRKKHAFYTGKISEVNYWNDVLEYLSIKNISSDFMTQEYRRYVAPIPENIELLSELSRSYTLIAFNNAPREWMDYRIKVADLNRYFGGYITSGYVGYEKPSDKFFSIAFKKHPPYQCIYIDDNNEYLQYARDKYRIPTVLFSSKADLQRLVR